MANTFIHNILDTWDDSLVEFTSLKITVTDTFSQTSSKMFGFALTSNTNYMFYGLKNGLLYANAGYYTGNSTVNAISNSSILSIANSTGIANLQPTKLTIGTAVVNTTVFQMGSNIFIDAAKLSIGNSTANLIANSILVTVANSTATANLDPGRLVVGTQIVNTTAFAAGANVFLSTVALSVGNSTANILANSILITVANSTGIANVQPGLVTVGISVVNTTAAAVGANVVISATGYMIGNSTVNAAANSSTLRIGNSTVNNAVTQDSMHLAIYALGAIPSAAPAGQIIYITGETGGNTLAFSDGTVWRRVSDRAQVS